MPRLCTRPSWTGERSRVQTLDLSPVHEGLVHNLGIAPRRLGVAPEGEVVTHAAQSALTSGSTPSPTRPLIGRRSGGGRSGRAQSPSTRHLRVVEEPAISWLAWRRASARAGTGQGRYSWVRSSWSRSSSRLSEITRRVTR